MDVEVEGRHDEVQKRSQSCSDWTLKQREGTMKSKKKSKLVGLDVYAEERHEKVQKGSRSMKKQKIQKISKKFKKAVDIILMW